MRRRNFHHLKNQRQSNPNVAHQRSFVDAVTFPERVPVEKNVPEHPSSLRARKEITSPSHRLFPRNAKFVWNVIPDPHRPACTEVGVHISGTRVQKRNEICPPG